VNIFCHHALPGGNETSIDPAMAALLKNIADSQSFSDPVQIKIPLGPLPTSLSSQKLYFRHAHCILKNQVRQQTAPCRKSLTVKFEIMY
jgi:hypothetical protein